MNLQFTTAVLELAHCTVGCHQAYRRTRDRIRLSFFWPTLMSDCKKFCRACVICQKTARVTVWDRVPITAVPRAQYAFQTFYIDCAGPLFPNEKTNAYNYFIVLCDSATSFPFAYPLRSLSAKNIADALIKTWTLTGVPESIIMDNAQYFRGSLVRELTRRLGCVPRFSTPYHPEGHAMAERLVGSIRRMIAKVAAEHPKQWHLYLDFILWALRESENESLGVAPWTLVFSRLPRGPLSVLKETWEGARDLPLSIGKGPIEFLTELQNKLEVAQKAATLHSKGAQAVSINRYNRRSRDKHFQVGEMVLILTPDSTSSRTFSRWQGPAQVVKVCSPYSYIVEHNSNQHHLHANKLKPFVVAADEVTCCVDFDTVCAALSHSTSENEHDLFISEGCAVITDADQDFGEIPSFGGYVGPGSESPTLPSQKIDQTQIAHLSIEKQQALLELLDKFSSCFSDDPGLCTLAVHEINLTPDFRPKRLRAYRVPEKLKPLVSIEIQRMLDLGVIRPSNSDMVSPLVVILKGRDGRDGIRLAVDYSYVNKYTRNDPFPVQEIDSVIQRVGAAKLISCFDLSGAYWQTRIRTGDEYLTAFICDEGVYEFVRTPFGGKASGSTFIRAIQQVLRPVKRCTDAYVDDVLVFSSDEFSQHLKDIEAFLERIREAKMTLKLKKCRFALPEVKFCGKLIGSGFKRPDPEKIAAVQNMRIPRTKTQVRQLLGFFSFFRDHVPNFAAIARPITDLTAKRVPNTVPWTEVHDQSFTALKEALCQATDQPLRIADLNLPFSISVDASDYAVAGYLSQSDATGVDHPLAFFSCKLSESQRAWATVHKEAYAVLVGLRKFRNWIFGSEMIHVYSDHNPLTFLTESAPKNAKLMRWSLALQEFNLSFHYIKVRLNVAPDCLSRMGTD